MKEVKKQDVEDPVFSVVVPVRDRWGPRLRNCIKSLENQTLQPLEIIVADYGSSLEGHGEIMSTLEPFNCSVYYHPTKEVWSLAIARNIGIRRSNRKCTNVAVVDADLILEPKVVEVLEEAHSKNHEFPPSYISCFIRMLKPDDPNQPQEELQLPEDFPKLKEIRFWPSAGWGGLVSAPRSWLFKVRGFDERMKLWGAEDSDLWKRAGLDGLACYRLNDLKKEDTGIFHQWHLDCLSWDQSKLTEEERNQIMWNKTIRAKDYTIVRNNEKWGIWQARRA